MRRCGCCAAMRSPSATPACANCVPQLGGPSAHLEALLLAQRGLLVDQQAPPCCTDRGSATEIPRDIVAYRLINPVLRGLVNYFAVGHSGKCFNIIKDWVEKKVRRHLARAQKRNGFGWEQWSRQWLYGTLGLFHGYQVRYGKPKVAPAR